VARRVGVFGFLKPSVYLRQQAITRGVFGGSRSFVVLAVFLYFPRLLRRLLGRTEVLVAREPMRSGQILRIEALGDLSKAERKAIRKAR
jgi:multisubunit Na+/H+ antiporter MnhG subunit